MIDLNQLRLTLARGENRFTMQRGSFSYRFKTEKRIRLPLKECSPAANGSVLRFGKGADKECLFEARRENGMLHLVCTRSPAGYNRWSLTLPAQAEEHFYGCGETYSKFDLRGEKVRIWVAEHQNAKRIGGKILRNTLLGNKPDRVRPFGEYESYYAQPTFVSSRGYFVHVKTDAYAEFDFSVPGAVTLNLQTPPELYLCEAESFSALSGKLAELLGHQRELPDWIYEGGILAVQEGPAVIEEKLRKALDAGAAVNGIWSQDWCGCRKTGFGYQVMWNWDYDRELYPELPEKILAWKEQGIRFLGYINPFLALEKPLYAEAAEKGYCVKDREGKDYLVTITTFPAAMVDFTNPAAYAWYKDIIKNNMIGIGMGGWMADFGEYLPADCVLYSGENPALIHNRWPAIWAQLNREAVEETGKAGEVFFFTRAGHTGTVAASAMMWTGDQHVDWSVDDGLPSVIPATLSLAMSGYGITHSDVGGYTTVLNMTRGKELLLRWMELGALSPLWRSHEGNQPSRNVQFSDDEELLAQLARTTRLHKALGGYLKALARENAERGVPVMRPLFYHYEESAAYTEMTEYLLGRDLLVAPVTKAGATEREVYLPEDNWVHAYTGEEYRGGVFTVAAPIGQPPVFIRRDSENRETLSAAFRQAK